jgi:hypothetical protein
LLRVGGRWPLGRKEEREREEYWLPDKNHGVTFLTEGSKSPHTTTVFTRSVTGFRARARAKNFSPDVKTIDISACRMMYSTAFSPRLSYSGTHQAACRLQACTTVTHPFSLHHHLVRFAKNLTTSTQYMPHYIRYFPRDALLPSFTIRFSLANDRLLLATKKSLKSAICHHPLLGLVRNTPSNEPIQLYLQDTATCITWPYRLQRHRPFPR